jgi:hypothetical protein
MSWKLRVLIAGRSKWAENGFRFATKSDAERWAAMFAARHGGIVEVRACESAVPVNYDPDTGAMNAEERAIAADEARL